MVDEKQLKPRKKPKQERSRLTFDAILEAAAQVFSELGYAHGTTNKIAQRAGVSIGSLYQYFPNKEAILIGLMNNHIENGLALVNDLITEIQHKDYDTKQILRRLIEMVVQIHLDEPKLHKLLLEEAPKLQGLFNLVRSYEEEYAGHLEAILRTIPDVKVRNISLAARLIIHQLEALTHWYTIYAFEDFQSKDFIDELVDMLEKYLFT